MSARKARVVAHRLLTDAQRVRVLVGFDCPYCGAQDGAAWHSPTSEGGERPTSCGQRVELVWPGIPGAVSAALIEYRPDILGRSDLATPEPDENGDRP